MRIWIRWFEEASQWTSLYPILPWQIWYQSTSPKWFRWPSRGSFPERIQTALWRRFLQLYLQVALCYNSIEASHKVKQKQNIVLLNVEAISTTASCEIQLKKSFSFLRAARHLYWSQKIALFGGLTRFPIVLTVLNFLIYGKKWKLWRAEVYYSNPWKSIERPIALFSI